MMFVYIGILDNIAFAEQVKGIQGTAIFLFEVPEQWLPNTLEEFKRACVYFKVVVPENVKWIGYVPF
jgi:hypothetical protein